MTADYAGWSLLDRRGRLEDLSRDECRRLLSTTNIGRFAYCTDAGPRIMPMNYTPVSEAVVFRTSIDRARHLTICSIIWLRSRLIRSMNSFRRDGAYLSWETPSPSTKSHCCYSTSGMRRSPGRRADERWSCNCH